VTKICICTTPIRPVPDNSPPFGSMAIIQSLQMMGEAPEFYHIDYFRPKDDEIIQYFNNNQFDIVGISSVVSTAYVATKQVSEIIKKANPKTVIIVGGNIVASANVLLKKLPIDFCVIGDGENIIQNLVKTIKSGNINDADLLKIGGISFIDSKGEFKFTGYEPQLPAEKILSPDYSILDRIGCLDYYIPKRNGWFELSESYDKLDDKRIASVVVAKGCVARCTFCHRLEKGYRVIPNEHVIKHIKLLKEKYNVGRLAIADENFGSNKNMTKDFVKIIGEMGFEWGAGGVRARTVDAKTLQYWADNGCKTVFYGIESGSPKMLKIMEKKITVEQNINAIKWTYQAGLSTVIQLVIGMPGEDDATIQETIDFLIRCMPYYPDVFRKKHDLVISINYAQSLPGTPLYEYARENGYIQKTIEAEEEYLIRISDINAYSTDHFINYTTQPMLKVLSWRYWIRWELQRYHSEHNLKIVFTRAQKLMIYLIMILRFISQIRIIGRMVPHNIRSFDILAKQDDCSKIDMDDNYLNAYFNLNTDSLERFSLIFPWNKWTYPFIVIVIAIKHSQKASKHFRKKLRRFLRLVFDHLSWSMKNIFSDASFPEKSLRKVVNITDTDETVLLRLGR